MRLRIGHISYILGNIAKYVQYKNTTENVAMLLVMLAQYKEYRQKEGILTKNISKQPVFSTLKRTTF